MKAEPEVCTGREWSYWSTCACPKHREEVRRRKALYTTGRPWRVPSDVAWKQLERWILSNWTARAISSAVGVKPGYFSRHLAAYRRGRRVTLGPVIAAKIMTAGRPTDGLVGAEPFRRRLRALAALGWGVRELSEESGLPFSTIAMLRSETTRVHARTAAIVVDTYDRLQMRPGPSAETARLAHMKAWAPPLAWDDIDDLSEKPSGSRDGDEPREVVLAELDESGADVFDACRALGISRSAIERWCERNGMRDVYGRLVHRVKAGAA
jgi:hypothetical protein